MSAPYEHYEPEEIFERYQFARARRSGLPSNAALDVIDPSLPDCLAALTSAKHTRPLRKWDRTFAAVPSS